MKKLLLSLLFLISFVVSASATSQTKTFTFYYTTYHNLSGLPEYNGSTAEYVSTSNQTISNSPVQIVFSTGDTWRMWSDGLRAYFGKTSSQKHPKFTVTADGANITSVRVTAKAAIAGYVLNNTSTTLTTASKDFTIDCGSSTTSAEIELTTTLTSSNKNIAIYTIAVTYDDSSGGATSTTLGDIQYGGSAVPSTLSLTGGETLTFTAANAASMVVKKDDTQVASSGEGTISWTAPAATAAAQTFTLTVTATLDSEVKTETIAVTIPGTALTLGPIQYNGTAAPTAITVDGGTALTFTSENAASMSVYQGTTLETSSGDASVTWTAPAATTVDQVYNITIKSLLDDQEQTADVAVTVTGVDPNARNVTFDFLNNSNLQVTVSSTSPTLTVNDATAGNVTMTLSSNYGAYRSSDKFFRFYKNSIITFACPDSYYIAKVTFVKAGSNWNMKYNGTATNGTLSGQVYTAASGVELSSLEFKSDNGQSEVTGITLVLKPKTTSGATDPTWTVTVPTENFTAGDSWTPVINNTQSDVTVNLEVKLNGTEITATDGAYTFAEAGIYNVRAYSNEVSGSYNAKEQTFDITVTAAATQKVTKPTFTPAAGDIVYGEKVTIQCSTEGAALFYRLNSATDWTAYPTDGIVVTEDVTIYAKATKDEMDDSDENSAAYTVTFVDPGLSFPQSSYTANVGGTFSNPTLTNPNSVTVTYTSSNENAATVDPTSGAVTIVGEGTTTIKAESTASGKYSAGEASYTLTVIDPANSYTLVNNDSDLHDGLELVICAKTDDYQKVMHAPASSGNNITAVDGTISGGVYTPNTGDDYTPYVLTLKDAGDGKWYLLNSEGKYLSSVTGSNNYLKVIAESAISDNTKAAISFSGDNATIQFQGTSGYGLVRYNSSSKIFSCYENDTKQAAVQIYAKKGGLTLSFANKSVTVVNGATVPANTLSYSVAAAEGHATFTSSNTAVATVDTSTGAVTTVAPGTTTITASVEASEGNYSAASTSYKLTVLDPQVSYKLVTSTSDLSDGMMFVIGSYGDSYQKVMAEQKDDNVHSADAVIADGYLTPSAGSYPLILKDAGNGQWNLVTTEGKYLSTTDATGSNLRAVAATHANPKAATISFDTDGNATITFATTATNATNTIMFNSGSSSMLFNCYLPTNTTQKKVQIYSALHGKKGITMAFDPTSVEAAYGSTPTKPTLTVTDAQASEAVYSSSDTSVATVDSEGNVTTVKPGTATITATIAETSTHSGCSASYSLKVTKADCGLNFDEDITTNGTTILVTATNPNLPAVNNPNNLSPITWTSSAAAVATINSETGALTIVGTGETTISANFAGNDYYNSGKASYRLTITADPNYVAPPTFSPESGSEIYATYGKVTINYTHANQQAYYQTSTDGTTWGTATEYHQSFGFDTPGTYYVKAWVVKTVDGETKNSAEVTAQYTVVDAGEATIFKILTDPKDINDLDTYVIYGNTLNLYGAMAKEPTTSNGKTYFPSDTSVAATGEGPDKQIAVSAAADISELKFVRTPNDEFLYYLKNQDGKYLHLYQTVDDSGNATDVIELVNTYDDASAFEVSLRKEDAATTHDLYATVKIVTTVEAADGTEHDLYLSYYGSGTSRFAAYDGNQAHTYLYVNGDASANARPEAPRFSPVVDENATVPMNQVVTITCATEDATLTYKIDGGTETAYDATTGVVLTTAGQHTIFARAKNSYGFTTNSITYTVAAVEATVSYSASAYTATIGGTNTFPTATTNPTTGPTLTYSSSNPSVAGVNPTTGEITLARAGEAVITATISNTDIYTEASASYTLTVNDASITVNGSTWQLCYSLDELNNYTNFIVVGTYQTSGTYHHYGLTSSTVTNNDHTHFARYDTELVSPDDNDNWGAKLTADPANVTVFNIVQTGDGHSVFRVANGANEGKYLGGSKNYCSFDETPKYFNTAMNTDGSSFLISGDNGSTAGDYLVYNSGESTSYFYYYNSLTNTEYIHPVRIYRNADDVAKTKTTLEFDPEVIETRIGATDFTSPTLTVLDDAAAPYVRFYSTDESVATVDASGNVTIVGPGDVLIYAYIAETCLSYYADPALCLISVAKPYAPISYKKAEYTVYLSDYTDPSEATLQSLTNPENLAVTYSTDMDPTDMMTGSNGAYTLIGKLGEGIITATFAGDDTYDKTEACYYLYVKSHRPALSVDEDLLPPIPFVDNVWYRESELVLGENETKTVTFEVPGEGTLYMKFYTAAEAKNLKKSNKRMANTSTGFSSDGSTLTIDGITYEKKLTDAEKKHIASEMGELHYISADATSGKVSTAGKMDVSLSIYTGVDTIDEAEDDDARYFNLQGLEVKEPVKGGIYIRIQNGRAAKIAK